MSATEPQAVESEPRPEQRSCFSEQDLYLFREGSHFKLHEHLGAHVETRAGRAGTRFAVWAPKAARVSLIGEFNDWQAGAQPLETSADSGIWEAFVPGIGPAQAYKFHVESTDGVYSADKSDPFAFHRESPPGAAAIVWDLKHEWQDSEWMSQRAKHNALDAPISIYEVHLGSWQRVSSEGGRFQSYRELADSLVPYVRDRGFTHVELLPICEHPFYGSWGYQTTGYFAPTSRYGTPQDLMLLVERFHQAGIGVILDWVPSHFPTDEHGLSYFDGTHLFEHEDPRRGFHPDWKSYIFDYTRGEVRSFLVSSALYWLSHYHFDGLRVDAVASMLHLDYSRDEGEWIPNREGGPENLEAIEFLRRLNQEVQSAHPEVLMIAEESSSWPKVSRPVTDGGLGFGLKWDMGWMNDTLRYFARDPLDRKFNQREISFRSMYAFDEDFLLPLSHDEVVHGKGSLIGKQVGELEDRFANLRLLFAYQYAQPGKKLLFMGGELAQWKEWDHDSELDWALLEEPRHLGIQRLVTDLNQLYRGNPELYLGDTQPKGFEWIEADDRDNSVISFLRKDAKGNAILVVLNMTPVFREDYRVGIPKAGAWRALLNTDARKYGGGGRGDKLPVQADEQAWHGRTHSLCLRLPPLAGVFFERVRSPREQRQGRARRGKHTRGD